MGFLYPEKLVIQSTKINYYTYYVADSGYNSESDRQDP